LCLVQDSSTEDISFGLLNVAAFQHTDTIYIAIVFSVYYSCVVEIIGSSSCTSCNGDGRQTIVIIIRFLITLFKKKCK